MATSATDHITLYKVDFMGCLFSSLDAFSFPALGICVSLFHRSPFVFDICCISMTIQHHWRYFLHVYVVCCGLRSNVWTCEVEYWFVYKAWEDFPGCRFSSVSLTFTLWFCCSLHPYCHIWPSNVMLRPLTVCHSVGLHVSRAVVVVRGPALCAVNSCWCVL